MEYKHAAPPYEGVPPPVVQYQYLAPPPPVARAYVVGPSGPWPQQPITTALHDLGHVETFVDCPYCGSRERTKTKLKSGNMNHAWAGCLFFTTVIFACVPYMCSGLKNVEHRCRVCHKRLALWHRSGHTQVR